MAPACLAAGIKIEPIQGDGYYQIEMMKHWIDDGKNSVMIWERVKNTVTGKEDIPLVDDKGRYWADVVAWVVDDDGEGEEIARYRKSLGYLDAGED